MPSYSRGSPRAGTKNKDDWSNHKTLKMQRKKASPVGEEVTQEFPQREELS